MDAVTYPDEKVTDYISNKYIALRLANNAEPYASDFMVKWTPRIIVFDAAGQIHQSTIGFSSPEEFIPFLELALAKADFNLNHLEECKIHLDLILNNHPNSFSAPEAVYYKGVTDYKLSGEAGPLKDAYNTLKDRYPDSEWTQRAAPYRLL
jgi:hypothetical protein